VTKKVQPFDKLRANGVGVMLAFLLAIFCASTASAQTFPPLAGEPVVDAANLLDPAQEAALNAKLKGIQASTGHQLAVATIPSLEGRDIADYGYRLLRTWALGTKEKDDGVILIIAPNERRTRIEVGYGLEPVLTDAYSSVIINSVIIPRFKGGDYPGGIDAGVDAIAQQIKLTPEEAAKRAAQAQARQPESGGMPGGIIFWIFIGLFVILPMLRGLGGRRHRGRSGLGDVILWSAINAAVNSRDNDGGGWGGGGGFGGGGGGFSGGGGSGGGGGASGGW
jgi:uncharacterized protein